MGFRATETTNIVRFRLAIDYHRPNAYGPCGLGVSRRQTPRTTENLVASTPNTYFRTPEIGELQFSSPA